MRISDWSSDVCSSDLVIRFLVEREIPVCAHLGLTPQSVLRMGGYKVQGRQEAAADKLREDAAAVADAGAALLVLEGVPSSLAQAITAASRSEEHTSELQSLMRISYAVFCLKKKKS